MASYRQIRAYGYQHTIVSCISRISRVTPQGMSKVSSGPLTPSPSPREGEGQGVRAARRPHDFAHALQPRPTLTWPYPKMRYNSHVAFT